MGQSPSSTEASLPFSARDGGVLSALSGGGHGDVKSLAKRKWLRARAARWMIWILLSILFIAALACFIYLQLHDIRCTTTIGVVGVLISSLASVGGCATYSPVKPPSYPLAVRSPYLSAWIPGNEVDSLPSSSAQFWAGSKLTWSVIARVDSDIYSLFGVADYSANVKHARVKTASYTSTHSTFTLEAGSRQFTLDFFSPVSPKDYIRQSLPFSYLTVTLAEGNSSSVQIYSDIDDSWTGQSRESKWSFSNKETTNVFQIQAANAATYSQNKEGQALWGSAVYATRPSDGSHLSSASGPLSGLRKSFADKGTLSGDHAKWTKKGAVAFAHDFGKASKKAAVTFAIGHVREEAIDYLGEAQTGYYRTKYHDTLDAVSHFLDDYADAVEESTKFDKLIDDTGISAHGTNYSDVLALSVRQVYGGIELTVPNDSLDTKKTRAFIKEISSDGNINTVDVIYATFPIFYILSPEYIKLLLSPIFDYMATDVYKKDYAVHEIGANYPNATGHPHDGEEMPVEESGNMIILTYAYQKATGNKDLATTYAKQLQEYAIYLLKNGLYPVKQLSLNDGMGPLVNQTNLAVKAAVGLATYGELVGLKKLGLVARYWAHKIWDEHLGTTQEGTHFVLQYGKKEWFMVYNHYADLLFDLNVFPKETYEATSKFYPTVRSKAGIPLSGNLGWGQTNWQAFIAATVGDETRDILINDMHSYITNGLNTAPFCDRYWTENGKGHKAGEAYNFRARPTLGSHFALAALKKADIWSP